MERLFEHVQRGAKAAGTNFMKWARKPTDPKRALRTVIIAGSAAALIAGTALHHFESESRNPRVQNVIRESLQGRASHIGEEVQKRGEFLTAMETQKRLNQALHTRKYLDRFWKFMETKSLPNLTGAEKKAFENFCKEHPEIPLTHLVVTLESNPPERGQSDESHVNEHLYGARPRKGVVLAAAYRRAATDKAFGSGLWKLQERGRDWPGYSMPSVEFMTRALDDDIRGLPKESSGLLSAVDVHWTGHSTHLGKTKGFGNMLPEIHAFRPSYTPFLAPGSIRSTGTYWIYSNEPESQLLKTPGAISFTPTGPKVTEGPESMVKPSARNRLITQAKKSFRGKPQAQPKPKRAPDIRRALAYRRG